MNHLPQAIATYIDAANAQNAQRAAASFREDATVQDEGHVWRGRSEIETWVRDSAARYQAVIEPARMEESDGRHSMYAIVRGNFPGSPINLNFHFRLASDSIASLEIGA